MMPTLSHADRGRTGGRTAAARMTPEQRRERARKAHLASAVAAVVNRAPELTTEQVAKLRAVFAPVVNG
ncbi:hypothetical protein [Micromonospora arborensis]|uniref:hypothetical protein n=1 Tax=Micromonospora arborensis TaxID=2116518 RepID=UPI00371C68E1